MKSLRAFILFLCLFVVAIGPLNVMQMVAWGSMIQSYSADRSISEATEMTFSGDYPCEMCRRIAEARANEGQDGPSPQPAPLSPEEREILRLDFSHSKSLVSDSVTWADQWIPEPGVASFALPGTHREGVPTPPPRVA